MKNRIYLDNAATTRIDDQVFEAMKPYLTEYFGNPSSTHSHGREAKAAVEQARKNIALRLGVSPAEIFFTSGGTEADNTILRNAFETFRFKTAITSPIEHHAVLHTLEELAHAGKVNLLFAEVDSRGHVDLSHLEELLEGHPECLVTLMHANNEVATVNPIDKIGELCRKHDTYFHSDSVQGIGHFEYDLSKINIHSIVCSAHKIHGPKGIGFMYQKLGKRVNPYITGGGQEREMRGGTENVASIVGLESAFSIAYDNLKEHKEHIQGLKMRMIQGLKESIPGVAFNGDSESTDSLFTVLNVSLPPTDSGDLLLFKLDIEGISASGGSACASGSDKGSHVLTALDCDPDRPAVRFSFSKFNTEEDIDKAVVVLKKFYE